MYDTATNVRVDKDPTPNTDDPRNNVQQLVYAQNVKQMVVKVYREAGFGPDQEEPFGLAVSQPLAPAVGPKLGLNCNANLNPQTNVLTVACTVTNTGDLPLFNLAVKTAGGAACQGIDPTKPLDPNGSLPCSIPSPGAGIVTINASAVIAEETFGATAIAVPPGPPPDCHGVTINPAQATFGPDGGSGVFDVTFPDPTRCGIFSVDAPMQFGWIIPGIGTGTCSGVANTQRARNSGTPLNPPPFPHMPPPPPKPPRSGFIEVALKAMSHLTFHVDQHN